MTDKTTDSTQPEAEATTEGLTIVKPGERSHILTEEADRDDPPVADTARELPSEMKDAVRLEGDWEGDAGRHDADNAQSLKDSLGDIAEK